LLRHKAAAVRRKPVAAVVAQNVRRHPVQAQAGVAAAVCWQVRGSVCNRGRRKKPQAASRPGVSRLCTSGRCCSVRSAGVRAYAAREKRRVYAGTQNQTGWCYAAAHRAKSTAGNREPRYAARRQNQNPARVGCVINQARTVNPEKARRYAATAAAKPGVVCGTV